MNATTKESFSNIDDLFNSSIDDLADLPGFETPPAGSYLLDVTMDVKKVNEKDCVEASFTVVETVELANVGDEPVVNGTVFSTLFMLDNKFGVGNLRKFLQPFGAHFGTTNIGELVREHLKDVSIAGTIKTRKDKNDPDRVYGSVNNITVA